jgi:hypothetical protein
MRNDKQKPIIRPGQRVPYHKGTQQEIFERRGCVLRLLARGLPKTAIHNVIKHTYNRQWRTTDRDIASIAAIANTWLARRRAREYRCSYPTGVPDNLQIIYGDKAK